MDKYELLGMVLQDLRDNRRADEEDIGPHRLRETTRIFELMVQHGKLTRNMFDLTGVRDPKYRFSVPKKYTRYQATNYPINFVVFADRFSDWLLGKDKRRSLTLIDLFQMVQEFSWLHIEIETQTNGVMVTVRSPANYELEINESVLVK